MLINGLVYFEAVVLRGVDTWLSWSEPRGHALWPASEVTSDGDSVWHDTSLTFNFTHQIIAKRWMVDHLCHFGICRECGFYRIKTEFSVTKTMNNWAKYGSGIFCGTKWFDLSALHILKKIHFEWFSMLLSLPCWNMAFFKVFQSIFVSKYITL